MEQDQLLPLNAESDWVFFDPDCAMSEEERARVSRLSEAASRAFWEANVSENLLERHPALLPQHHWLSFAERGPDWLAEKSPGHFECVEAIGISQYLRDSFGLGPDEQVLFVLMRESVYSAPLSIFLKYWADFLHLGDEFPFLFHVQSGTYACFGPNGQIYFGRKASDALHAL